MGNAVPLEKTELEDLGLREKRKGVGVYIKQLISRAWQRKMTEKNEYYWFKIVFYFKLNLIILKHECIESVNLRSPYTDNE